MTGWDEGTIGGIIVGIFTLAVTGRTLAMRAMAAFRRPALDPQRLFDGPQKTIGRKRSGNRCEHKHPLWFRCKGGADEADHIYPWSRGGATSLGNLQYLCVSHNRRKSAWVPTRSYIWRLERRRRRYFPPDEDLKVYWKQGGQGPTHRPRLLKQSAEVGRVPASFYVGISDRGNDDQS